MTIEKIADKLKKNEITYDEAYIAEILKEEKEAKDEIKYLLLLFFTGELKKRNLYKEINRIVEELFINIGGDMSLEFAKRHEEGYFEGSYIAQILKGKFSKVPKVQDYNPKWHLGNGSFLDDLVYYKNRLIDDLRKEIERMVAFKAPVEKAVKSVEKPFNKLFNSSKTMIDTEMVYAERQGMKDAYTDNDAKQYRYIATLDTLTCERCGELDGRVFMLSQAFVGANYPPMHPHCRCTTIPVFPDFDTDRRYAKDENGETIEVVGMTYPEWKKKYVV